MSSAEIKICGISTAETLEATIAARADYCGFMFVERSPRFVAPQLAASLGARAEGRIRRVGVFVDARDAELADAVQSAKLDVLQFHGSESVERVAEAKARFRLPVWKVLSVASASDIAKADAYHGLADLILFDAKTPKGELSGGLGLRFDWTLLAGYHGPTRWGLAGGLNPGNVAEAIRLTGAPLVDASSGVERATGVKDSDKIAAFCQAARNA